MATFRQPVKRSQILQTCRKQCCVFYMLLAFKTYSDNQAIKYSNSNAQKRANQLTSSNRTYHQRSAKAWTGAERTWVSTLDLCLLSSLPRAWAWRHAVRHRRRNLRKITWRPIFLFTISGMHTFSQNKQYFKLLQKLHAYWSAEVARSMPGGGTYFPVS